jgi:CheY-like chemotaxis protein
MACIMSRRILIIERSRTIQTLLSIYFRNAGHQMLACSTPQEALKLMADLRQAPECIVVAVHAPEQEDYRFIRVVRGQLAYAGLHLVALVLHEDMAEVQRRLKDVPISYLAKPFRIQDALALVAAPVMGSGVPSGTREK